MGRTGPIVTSCLSPSAGPPLLLAAISAGASTFAAIEREGCSGRSVLSDAQEGEARFEGAEREAPETGDATAALPWHRGRVAAAQPTR